MTKEEKKDKILDLYTELVKSGDNVIRDFFDLSSDKMLDKKIYICYTKYAKRTEYCRK